MIEVAKYFYWFFSKENLIDTAPANMFVTFEKAQKYNQNLEDDLRARFVAAMSIAVNSLWKSAQEKNIELEYEYVQDIAESIIYNTLFIRSCESRRVLPLHQTYIPISLHNLLGKLREFQATDESFSEVSKMRLKSLFKENVDEGGADVFTYLINLFDLTNDSEKKSRALGFAIEGFRENIFSNGEWVTLKKVKIDNLSFAKILRTLFFIEGESQLPFNVLTPQQFGSIFESFLEFKLSKVGSAQYLVKRYRKEKADIFWEEKPKATDGILYVAKRGSLYFRPDNLERKISGSYYTPDHVVDLIVNETLRPLVKSKTAVEILKVRVCDPAMGSGHFLISALRFLTAEYLKKGGGATSPASAKVEVLHNCIFGVDKSRRAIKLGKLALWLETAESGKFLEHLDDQVKCTNSLTDKKLWKDEWKFLKEGVDAIIGNPPFVSFYSRHSAKEERRQLEEILTSEFKSQFQLIDAKGPNGRYNLSMFFFELAFELVKPRCGRVGMIGDIGFEEAAYLELRQILLRNNIISKYYRKLSEFESVNSEQIIVIGAAQEPRGGYEVECIAKKLNGDTTYINVVPGKSDRIWPQEEVEVVGMTLLGNIFEVSTGVNIGGSSERFLSKSGAAKSTYPFISAADFDQCSRVDLAKVDTHINFSDKLSEKVNAESKAAGSKNVVVLGNLDRFRASKLFLRQSSQRLTCSFEKATVVSSYSVFVINCKDEDKLKLLEVLFHTEYYDKLAWRTGIVKGGGGKQPQMRKGNLQTNKLGVVNFPLPVELFESAVPDFAMKWIVEFNKSQKVSEKQKIISVVNDWLLARDKKRIAAA